MAQIELQDVKKTYQDHGVETRVLNGVNLKINRGERVAVVGASGVGKSTLLHLIGSLDNPTSGKIFIEGKDLFTESENQLCKFRNRRLGFVFQFHHLLPDFSALENVMMPLLIAGLAKKQGFVEASKMLDYVGLNDRKKHLPTELSGGEQQRVALARALVHRPEIVLADEPTGNLDLATGEKIFDLLLALNRELNTTFIIVTHNEGLSRRFDRVVRLAGGILNPI